MKFHDFDVFSVAALALFACFQSCFYFHMVIMVIIFPRNGRDRGGVFFVRNEISRVVFGKWSLIYGAFSCRGRTASESASVARAADRLYVAGTDAAIRAHDPSRLA